MDGSWHRLQGRHSAKTDVIITTFDQGISLALEFDGHGFQRVATWRTPTWEDINSEIMNRYYTKHGNQQLSMLSSLRGAHNLWYVYSKKPVTSQAIKRPLSIGLYKKNPLMKSDDFESVLDECGYRYSKNCQVLFSQIPHSLGNQI